MMVLMYHFQNARCSVSLLESKKVLKACEQKKVIICGQKKIIKKCKSKKWFCEVNIGKEVICVDKKGQ